MSMTGLFLNCSRTGAVVVPRTFGRGSGPILLDDVTCTGTENTIFQCSSKPIGQNNCQHREDVGVRCQVGKSMYHCCQVGKSM